VAPGDPTGPRFLVEDIYPGDSSSPHTLRAVGNKLYFSAEDAAHGKELWISDGTEPEWGNYDEIYRTG